MSKQQTSLEHERPNGLCDPLEQILPRHTMPTSPKFKDIDDEIVGRLDRKFVVKRLAPYPRMLAEVFNLKSPPLVCSKDLVSMGQMIGWFRACGLPVDITENPHDLFEYLSDIHYLPSILVVDLDGIGADQGIMESFIPIREKFTDVPMIFISKSFMASDFGTTRISMGDLFLRRQPYASEMEDFLDIALANNKKWETAKTPASQSSDTWQNDEKLKARTDRAV